MRHLTLFNSLQNRSEIFVPRKKKSISMYSCGPTVYDEVHIGNIRTLIVTDLLHRVLKYLFSNVIYVRNITDVDDKIIVKAKELGLTGRDVANKYEIIFKSVCEKTNCLPPTFEPRAGDHIEEIISIVQKLLDLGHAYESNGSVYFKVSSFSEYGALSHHKEEDLITDTRISTNVEKHAASDFVLWKADDEDGNDLKWQSPWSVGRPGWHIECSAMSTKYLGQDFDIHCGGADLKFPHHENEIAQNKCAFKGSCFAGLWFHVGMLTVSGQKMSKSIGNVLKFSDLNLSANQIRIAMFLTHYRKPINWDDERVNAAKEFISDLSVVLKKHSNLISAKEVVESFNKDKGPANFLEALLEDLNTHEALRIVKLLMNSLEKSGSKEILIHLLLACQILGLDLSEIFEDSEAEKISPALEKFILEKINLRNMARVRKDFFAADNIRQELIDLGIEIFDHSDGTTSWTKN